MAVAGDTFPSELVAYTDQRASLQAYRLTQDGNTFGGVVAANYLQDMSGEQSSSSPWAPDSVQLCWTKGVISGSGKSAGIYKMNTDTGVQTMLAPLASSHFQAYPVWSRDGSNEVYYMDYTGGNTRIRAVLASAPWTQRTLASVASNGDRQKVCVNADGTMVSGHIRPTDASAYRTIIARTDGSGILSGWGITGPTSADGSYWHRTDPVIIGASRGNGEAAVKVYNALTLAQIHATSFRSSHAAVHPDGTRIIQIDSGTYRNFNTGAIVFDKGGQGQTHPCFFPSDVALGDNARCVFDEAQFFSSLPLDRPALWVTTPAQMSAASGPGSAQAHRTGTEVGLHWTRSSSNGAHPHPCPSPDGNRIVWVSDKRWVPASYTSWFPGTSNPDPTVSNGNTDLFMLVLNSTPPAQSNAPRAWHHKTKK